jgi:aspartyl-tRNA(Asn)/glutamyl-tRNA(Gln) amidotransferase subunit B
MNSFRAVERAIAFEIERQAAALDAGEALLQETRGWSEERGETYRMRVKETSDDYRYFPEPDLPPLVIDANMVSRAKAALPESPAALRARWTSELGLPPATAVTLSAHPSYAAFFEAARQGSKDALKVANVVTNDVLRSATAHGLSASFSVTPDQVRELISLIDSGQISGKQAKEVFAAIAGNHGKSPAEVVKEKGLKVMSDAGAVEGAVRKVVAGFPDQVAILKAGKKGVIGFLVGQVMKETGGSADPKLVNELLNKLIAES